MTNPVPAAYRPGRRGGRCQRDHAQELGCVQSSLRGGWPCTNAKQPRAHIGTPPSRPWSQTSTPGWDASSARGPSLTGALPLGVRLPGQQPVRARVHAVDLDDRVQHTLAWRRGLQQRRRQLELLTARECRERHTPQAMRPPRTSNIPATRRVPHAHLGPSTLCMDTATPMAAALAYSVSTVAPNAGPFMLPTPGTPT